MNKPQKQNNMTENAYDHASKKEFKLIKNQGEMKSMSKKLLSAILGILLMAIVLVGCGSKPAESDNNAPAPETEGIAVATAEEVAVAIKDGTAIVVDARSNEA